MVDGDLRRVWDKAVRAAELRNRIPGRLGKPGGAVVVTARPGYLYVRLSSEGGQTVVIARNDGVPRRYDLPVWLELEHNVYVISGVDGTRLEAFLGTADGGGGGVGYHVHRTGSGLEYEHEATHFEPGRVKHFTGLQVQINPFRYSYGGAWDTYPGGILDLTSYKPAAAGTHAWVLVGVNPATNAATATAGTAQGYATPLTPDLIDSINFGDSIPMAAVKVRADDTSLANISKYQDAHGWFNGAGGGGSSSVSAVASETLTAGDLVDLWSDGGTLKVRRADADAGYAANGFVLAAVTSGNTASVSLGGTNDQVSGLTGGQTLYLSTTAGGATGTPPTGTGELVQPVGVAVSATSMVFQPKISILLA